MNTSTNQTCPAHLPPMTDEELEREAIAELERMERALNRKKSDYQTKRRGRYEDRRG